MSGGTDPGIGAPRDGRQRVVEGAAGRSFQPRDAGARMTDSLKLSVDRRGGVAVIYTDGYINNQGGEEIAKIAYGLLDEGFKTLLLNLAGTKIVNSIGISILIEIIEKMLEVGGKLAFCNLTPTIDKTFHIMGLAQYSSIYPDEAAAFSGLGS
jgi:anti-anti-sigma factor